MEPMRPERALCLWRCRPTCLSRQCWRLTAWTLFLLGWALWVAALPLPFAHVQNNFTNPATPALGTFPVWFIVLAGLGAFVPAEPVEIGVRVIGIGYYAGLAACVLFPAVRGLLRPVAASVWTAAACVSLGAPWAYIFWDTADHHGFTVGALVFAFGHLLICAGVWMLVPDV